MDECTKVALLILIGSCLILYSGELETDLIPKTYDLWINARLANGAGITLNKFSWQHNFSEDKGAISFLINYEENLGDVTINFPTFLGKADINLHFLKCESYNNCKEVNYAPKLDYIPNPVNNPKYTTLVISNFSSSLKDHELVINYNLHLEPHGTFQIFHDNINIPSLPQNIAFDIGEKYTCVTCFVESESRYVSPSYLNVGKKVMLNFEEYSWHRVKLVSSNEDKVYQKSVMSGLGMSLLASGIVWALQRKRSSPLL